MPNRRKRTSAVPANSSHPQKRTKARPAARKVNQQPHAGAQHGASQRPGRSQNVRKPSPGKPRVSRTAQNQNTGTRPARVPANRPPKQERSARSQRIPQNAGQNVGAQNIKAGIWSKDGGGSGNASLGSGKRSGGATGVLQTILGFIILFFTAIWHGFKRFGGWLGSLMHRNRVVGVIVIALLVFAVGGLADTALCWGKVYNGVKIGSLDVGGMSVEAAQDLIRQTYSPRLNGSSITIYANQTALDNAHNGIENSDLESSEEVSVADAAAAQSTWITDAQTLQARLNTDSLAQQALDVGRGNGGFFTRLGALLFGYEIDPTLQMNDNAVETLASDIDETLGNPRVNYNIDVEDGVATVTAGHDGNEIDREWLTRQLTDEFLSADSDHAFVARIDYAPLQITEAEAAQAAAEVNDAIGKGATFVFNDASWTADSTTIGSWIKTKVELDSSGDKLCPYLDESVAKPAILKHLSADFDTADANVNFTKTGNSVMVQTSASGTMPIVSDAITALDSALFGATPPIEAPTITVQGTAIPASMSVQAALDYGIISVFSTYETEYTANAEARNNNIHLAASLLNNSIVESGGGTWSFNTTAGECNAEKGFQGAGVIIDGETVDEIGGGICQVATTVFNAVYESGLPVVRRSNHSLYIASYPAGRDAAVSWPDLDLIWQNDTNSDILVQTSYTDTSVTVNLIGVNPGLTVTSSATDFVAGEKYTTKTVEDNELTAAQSYTKQNGSDGRSITVTRTVKDANGEVVRTDTFNSVYDAKDEIIVKGTKDSKTS